MIIINSDKCRLHEMGEHHPERPARLDAISDQLIASGLEYSLTFLEAEPIDKQLLSLAHKSNYIDSLFSLSPKQGYAQVDPDTSMNKHSLEAALIAAGAGIQGIDLLMTDKERKVFCAVRPPGHHAEADRAMGFCFFNNIALAAKYALEKYSLNRVAILDFDVHHGNGTENIVSGDHRVLFCSIFQHPFYPYTSLDNTSSNVINVPLSAGAKGMEFREKIWEHWFPSLEAFQPELVLVSAGFDGHLEDEMAQWCLVEDDYFWVSQKIRDLAEKHCSGRVLSMLEGGYALSALGRSVVAHLKGLLPG
ncbi:histone deacetylase family protein [Pleionea litopenaei]|uniref:Histone deacetylase family protein n=1 Tax=Pleionea litopenaei TaxID=3070815 RepID=A0AA51RVY8_9GAMM|nr:histone deacetylase family protein [Pleionea sp. HL-JVS1]WMS88453.1 histone deacetylase family protein [Pleionea sp. HL-JVS1]